MNTLLPNLPESMSVYRRQSGKKKSQVRIAILPSFTLKGLRESLFTQLQRLGIMSEIYVPDYKQHSQDILNPQSKLYSFAPDILFLFIDIRSLLGDDYFLPYEKDAKQRQHWVQEKLEELQNLIETFTNRSRAKIIVHNFPVPTHSPLSLVEIKQTFGFHESILDLNARLARVYKNNSQVFIFDYEHFCSHIGKENIFNFSLYHLGDIQVNFDSIPRLAQAYVGYIKPLLSLAKKCIVLDLDNTLWGGVIGEEGLGGIKLGPTPEGRPFLEFQKHLLALFKRGVILAINSKNNEIDALEVLRKHPYMVLKEQHFAAMQINWNDKASNMKIIAQDLNIGLDSLVFFDDDKANRELVRTIYPEILTIDLPANPADYSSALLELNDFNSFYLTDEDLKKGELYVQQRERKVYEQNMGNIDNFLKNLKVKVTLESVTEFNLPRIAQLTQKTNQFNLTTYRYSQEDIEEFMAKGALIVAVRVEDKFGDNGLTGVVIVERGASEWHINTFLLSCRVIGKKVEESMLWYIIDQAKKARIKQIVGVYIPTKKNDLVKDFYKKNKFKLKEEKDGLQTWVHRTSNSFPKPSLIKIVLP